MDQLSATTHRFHSTHPRSPAQPQSLKNEHLDLTAVTAAATMMHSAALGDKYSPTAAHTFHSGRCPSYGHRLRLRVRFHSTYCNLPLPLLSLGGIFGSTIPCIFVYNFGHYLCLSINIHHMSNFRLDMSLYPSFHVYFEAFKQIYHVYRQQN